MHHQLKFCPVFSVNLAWLSAEQVLAQVLSDDDEDLDDSGYGNGSDFESKSSRGSDNKYGDNNQNNARVVPAAVGGCGAGARLVGMRGGVAEAALLEM